MDEVKQFLNEAEEAMEMAVMSLDEKLSRIRAGRANASVLDRIQVDYYGSPTPIQQIASVSVPDPRSLIIQPWDQSVLKGIEKVCVTEPLGGHYGTCPYGRLLRHYRFELPRLLIV